MTKKEYLTVSNYIDSLFPDAKCELFYQKDYELVIAVMLSAQTTDKAVNQVTESLFKDYPTLEALDKAPLENIENHIKRLGMYKNKTSFPLNNITKHQIEHLKRVIKHGGIAFFIIQFESLGKVYILDASYVIHFYEKEERKSIPLSCFEESGIEVEQSFNPRLKYIDAIEKLYF